MNGVSMPDNSCLFTVVHTAAEDTERVLRALVSPVAGAIRGRPELDSLFYGCFSHPDPQVRFRILGERAWVEGPVRQEMERRLAAIEEAGLAVGHEIGRYGREVERYGGEEGMRLTERIYHHDSLACLDLIEAEARGAPLRSRREIAVVMTERMLDLLGMQDGGRLAFYEFAARWPDEEGDWSADDLAAIDARYASLREGLAFLASDAWPAADPLSLWGGEEAAAIAGRSLGALAPILAEARAGHDAGRIRRDLVYLAWSWTHLHCNRLGIPALSEAILRQLMLRHYRGRVAAG